jgi:hypothetical protein
MKIKHILARLYINVNRTNLIPTLEGKWNYPWKRIWTILHISHLTGGTIAENHQIAEISDNQPAVTILEKSAIL